MAQHTAGPWKMAGTGPCGRSITTPTNGFSIIPNIATEAEEAEANAQLIAESPNLLACLEFILGCVNDDGTATLSAQVVLSISNTVLKAKGETA